jgi:hypothetical protein
MAKSYKKYGKRASLKRRFRGGQKGGNSGCSTCQQMQMKGGSRKKRGGNATVLSLAYPADTKSYASNPNLAFTGYKNPNVGPPNSALANAYPNPGPTPTGFNFLNPLQGQLGGKYPNGLTGETWNANTSSWPGVKPVDSNGNHYALNTYKNDVSRQMVDLGAAPPFNIGGRRKRRSKKNSRSKKGGMIFGENSLLQDVVNVGRQIKTGFGGVYDGLNGYKGPVSPLPWKGQLTNNNGINSLKYKF